MIAEIIHKIPVLENENKEQRFYTIRGSMCSIPASNVITGTRCTRQMAYNRMGFVPKPIPGRSYFIFDDSQTHEYLTRNWLLRSPFQIHSNQLHVNTNMYLDFLPERTCHGDIIEYMMMYPDGKIEKKFNPCGEKVPAGHISSHIDGILTDLLKRDFLWEHKAISTYTFQKYKTRNEIPWDYIAQCCNETRGIIEQYDMKIDGIILTIKDKNSSQYLDLELEYDIKKDIVYFKKMICSDNPDQPFIYPEGYSYEGIYGDIVFKFMQVEECANKNKLPPREYEPSDWQCQFCQFQEQCYEHYEEEFKELKADMIISSNDVIQSPNGMGDINFFEMIRKWNNRKEQVSILTKVNESDRDLIISELKHRGAREAILPDANKLVLSRQPVKGFEVAPKDFNEISLLEPITAKLPDDSVLKVNLIHRSGYVTKERVDEVLRVKKPKIEKIK